MFDNHLAKFKELAKAIKIFINKYNTPHKMQPSLKLIHYWIIWTKCVKTVVKHR